MTVIDSEHRGRLKRDPDGTWVVYCGSCHHYNFLTDDYRQSYHEAKRIGWRRNKFASGYWWRCPYCVEHDHDIWIGDN